MEKEGIATEAPVPPPADVNAPAKDEPAKTPEQEEEQKKLDEKKGPNQQQIVKTQELRAKAREQLEKDGKPIPKILQKGELKHMMEKEGIATEAPVPPPADVNAPAKDEPAKTPEQEEEQKKLDEKKGPNQQQIV